MSQENVDFVRSIFEAWERGDYSATEWADPEIEVVMADGPSPGSWRGLTGMSEGMREFVTAWDDYRAKPDEFRELDDERVLVLIQMSGRGKRSGVDLGRLRTKGAALLHVRGGKVTRLVRYWNRERLFADLGLSE